MYFIFLIGYKNTIISANNDYGIKIPLNQSFYPSLILENKI